MAWSAPPAFTVSQIVTAAQMNILSDDLSYLKGISGAVSIEDAVRISPTAGTVPTYAQLSVGDSAEFYVHSVVPNTLNGGGGTNADNIDLWFNYVGYNGSTTRDRNLLIGDGKNNQIASFIGSTRNMGVNVSAPQGKIHAAGAGGGWMYLSANAVTSLQTIAIAGTVQSGMIVWLCDRNNTGGAFTSGFNGQVFSLTSALTYINTDTLTLTLTAGGAITIQRTTGTNGSHQVNLAVMYF